MFFTSYRYLFTVLFLSSVMTVCAEDNAEDRYRPFGISILGSLGNYDILLDNYVKM